jgi:hypothetical protein
MPHLAGKATTTMRSRLAASGVSRPADGARSPHWRFALRGPFETALGEIAGALHRADFDVIGVDVGEPLQQAFPGASAHGILLLVADSGDVRRGRGVTMLPVLTLLTEDAEGDLRVLVSPEPTATIVDAGAPTTWQERSDPRGLMRYLATLRRIGGDRHGRADGDRSLDAAMLTRARRAVSRDRRGPRQGTRRT